MARRQDIRIGAELRGKEKAALSSSETAPIPDIVGAPATLDWRNVGGISYVSPVKSQGSCGSCWAFATTAGTESQLMIATGGMPIDLAEQILVSCSNAGSCSGGVTVNASNFIRDVGLPLESCFKYTATNNVCSNACLNWQDNTYKIKGWHRASTTYIKVDDIRNALFTYGPLIVTMSVYSDFYSYRSGVYSYATGSYVGDHAVLVVGYDDAQRAFVVKNSWGSGWGEAGYFMISYGEVGGATNLGASTIAYDGFNSNPAPDPDPAPEPEPDPSPDPDPEPCSYSLSSTKAVFQPAGGTGKFMLYSQGSCSLNSMTVSTSSAWVHPSLSSIKAGSATVTYAVDPNSGPARLATISIAGLAYTVNQQKAKTSKTR